jgi:transcriptional regulator with XRE-family HTH domain
MNTEDAKRFGEILRKRREALGLSVRQVADLSQVLHSTVLRIEGGEFAAPRPDKLARLAAALQLSPAELFAQAGYFSPDDLPDFTTYLAVKHPNLPASDAAELQQRYEEVLARSEGTPDRSVPTTEELVDDPAGGAI